MSSSVDFEPRSRESIPSLSRDAVAAVVATVLRAESQNALAENLRLHRLMTQGVSVEYRDDAGCDPAHPRVVGRLRRPREQRLARRQPVHGRRGRKNRRPDVVVFVNGLPLGLLELKNPGDENATLQGRLEPDPDLPQRHPGDLHAERRLRRLRRHRRR